MKGEIVYVTTNQVIALNTVQIRLYSPQELVGAKDPGILDSAINRPKQTLFGIDAYPSIYETVAALFESIAKNHAFHNANKRTALASLIVFLKINHYRWTMGIEEEQNFTVDVMNHKYTFEEIVSINKKIQKSYKAILA